MRHPSSLSLHRIAAAAAAQSPLTAAAMFFRPPVRGGRGRRSFSDRPFSGDTNNIYNYNIHNSYNGQNVNPGLNSSNFSYNNNNSINNVAGGSYRAVPPPIFSYMNNNSMNNVSGGGGGNYRAVPPPNFSYSSNNSMNNVSGGRGRGSNRAVPPPIPQNQQGRGQRPRPADFRGWEYAKNYLPSSVERFVVLSYNILADYLANGHRKLYFHVPRRFMSWEWRKSNILFELGLWSPDIMCFQEVDRFNELEEDFGVRGYSGIWKMRTGDPVDGCAIFWRTTRFKLMYEECIEFNKHGMRNNVAQICVLESLIQNRNGNHIPPSSSEGPNRVVVCNIHVLYNPGRGEMKLGQVRLLLERAQAVSKTWNDAPIVLCGDFNCTPKSPLYKFISEQKLDISEVERDKVSGQASAEIIPPPRQYGHQSREQPSADKASPLMAPNNSIDQTKNDSSNNQNAPEIIVKNLPGRVFSKQNGGLMDSNATESTANCKISQTDNTEMCKDEIRSAKSADHLIQETLHDPEISSSESSTEKLAGSGLLQEEHQIRLLSITDDSTGNFTSDKLSSSTSDSNTNTAEKGSGDNNNNKCPSENFSPSSSVSTEVHVQGLSMDLPSESVGVEAELHPTSVSSGSSSVSPEVHFPGMSMDVPSQSVGIEADLRPIIVSEAGETNTSTAFKYSDRDEKIIDLPLNEIDEPIEDNENSGEHAGDVDLDADTVYVHKPSYDPSLWTPMEIATATGKADCTVLEHPLKLRSTYLEVVGSSDTRDSYGEPLVTSYNSCFMGTVDYIWRSEGLQTIKVLAPISKDVMQPSGGFPTKKWGSDHIALASELAFNK